MSNVFSLSDKKLTTFISSSPKSVNIHGAGKSGNDFYFMKLSSEIPPLHIDAAPPLLEGEFKWNIAEQCFGDRFCSVEHKEILMVGGKGNKWEASKSSGTRQGAGGERAGGEGGEGLTVDKWVTYKVGNLQNVQERNKVW